MPRKLLTRQSESESSQQSVFSLQHEIYNDRSKFL